MGQQAWLSSNRPPLRRRPTPVLHEGPPKPVPLLQGDPQVTAIGEAPCPSRAVTAPSPESRAPHLGGSAGLACPGEAPRFQPGPHPPAQQRPWAPAPALSQPLRRCRLSRQSSVLGVKTKTALTSGCWATCPARPLLGRREDTLAANPLSQPILTKYEETWEATDHSHTNENQIY